MLKQLGRRTVRILLAATGMLACAAGIALATIPGSGGVVNGCYEKKTGILRVIDAEAGKKCLSFETAISWNQQGLKGDPGAQGIQGPSGGKGESGQQGLQGVQGEKGEKGNPGAQGLQGEKGDPGTQGLQGEHGLQGEQGLRGIQGLQGERGPQGLPGSPGAPGGLSGWEVVTRTFDNEDEKGGFLSFMGGTVICPDGKVATGGGYRLRQSSSSQNLEGITVLTDAPFAGIGWSATLINLAAAGRLQLDVHVICAQAG